MLNSTLPLGGAVSDIMETACECYQMAEECERLASEVKSESSRQLLIRIADQWRKLGKLGEAETSFQPSSELSQRT